MEARGAHKFEMDVFENYDAFVREFVSNDDSRIRKVSKHKCCNLLRLDLIREMPKYDNGKVKPDNGELPINHVEIDFRTDRSHQVRTVAGLIFKLVRKKNDNFIGTTHNAERLKRNFSYAIRSNCEKELCNLEKAVQSILEHHFNNHELCGDWCQYKNLSENKIRKNYDSGIKNSS